MSEIKQNTPEWLEAKKDKIGASEIFTLVAHYCKEELKQANIDLGDEKAFKTPLELYLKVKFAVQNDSISEVNSQFGLGMENYILYRLGQEEKFKDEVQFEGSKDFIEIELMKGVEACCSPDGYVNFQDKEILTVLEDFDNTHGINATWGQGVLELKTTPYNFNYKAEEGLKFSYIFQLNFQMLVCNKKWGILAAIAPKEKSYDTDFFKGKVLGKIELINDIKKMERNSNLDEFNCDVFEQIYKFYNLYHYIYPENKTIQNLCILALKRFQKALDDNILPNLSIDCLERLTRERALLSIMKPERYGLINARKDEELNGLINDLKAASTEQLKIKTEMEAAKCDLIQKMDNHIGIEGSDWTYKFAKDGSLRFSKTKEGKSDD